MAVSREHQMRIATALILSLSSIVVNPAEAWWLFSNEQTTVAPAATNRAPVQVAAGQSQLAAGNTARQMTASTNNNNNNNLGRQSSQEIKAVAQFNLDGVKGAFRFAQLTPTEPTRVEYDISGLKGNNKLFHVHVRPVPEHNHEQVSSNSSLIGQLCADPATGGHLNPYKITQKLPPKSAPLDKYEIGDLSGKHGPLVESANQRDRYMGSFVDDKLPMSGEHSIVGRSIVIHKNDGQRWVCASILPIN